MADEEAQTAGAGPAAPKSPVRTLVEWVLVIGGAVVLALLIKTFVVQAFYIPTGSMEPTLIGELRTDGTTGVGDRILVNKLSYRLHDINRGDVVVFENPDTLGQDTVSAPGGTPPVADLVKRVIGLPGDRVVITDGHVAVNGETLAEPYLPAGTETLPAPASMGWSHLCSPNDPCEVPAGSVWVMGDNRTHSKDSRYLGPIREDTILGHAFVIVWPFGRASGL